MAEFNGIERREFVRLSDPLKGEFRLFKKNTNELVLNWHNCISDNISLGGICIQVSNVTNNEIDELTNNNNIFEIKVYLSEQKELITKGDINFFKIIGKAVWNNLSGEVVELGLKFVELDKDSEKLIKNIIIQQYIKTYGK